MAAEMMMPEWVGRMQIGCWYRISGDRPDLGLTPTARGTRYLQDTDPARDERINPASTLKERFRRLLGRRPYAPWQGRCGFPSITEAWNGAVLASRFGASGSMVIFGGGHDDYFGSSVHAFDLATRQWARLSEGYVTGRENDYGAGAVYTDSIYPDGSPLPPHTYGYVQYDPVGNDFILLRGQIELGPQVQSIPIPHLFNLNNLQWRRGPKNPSAILGSGGWTAWDGKRRILWGQSGDSGNAFVGFSPDGDNGDGTSGSWTTLFPKKIRQYADHNAMTMDTARDLLIATDHAARRLAAIDPSEPAKECVGLTLAGEIPKISEYAALEYSPSLDQVVYFEIDELLQTYSLAAPSGSSWSQWVETPWTSRRLISNPNSLDPIADAAALSAYAINRNQIFGRFRIATYGQIDVAILVRHIDTPVYALRLN
jgi:hypothetical protein